MDASLKYKWDGVHVLLHAVILKLPGKMETRSHILHPDKIEADKAEIVTQSTCFVVVVVVDCIAVPHNK